MITKERLSSFWFWYLTSTLVYLLLSMVALNGEVTLLSYVAGFVGLFVPFGLMSLILLTTPFGWAGVILFFVCGHFFSKWLNQQNLPFTKKVFLIFLALLLLTTLVDFVRQTPLASWRILIDGELDLHF